MTRRFLAVGLLALLTLPAITPRIYASDEVEYFAFLRSLTFVAGSFGQRRFVEVTPVAALCVWWNLGLLSFYRQPRQ